MKHNLNEAIEILDTEVAFLPLYLYEWKEELQQRNKSITTSSTPIITFDQTIEFEGNIYIKIDEVLGVKKEKQK